MRVAAGSLAAGATGAEPATHFLGPGLEQEPSQVSSALGEEQLAFIYNFSSLSCKVNLLFMQCSLKAHESPLWNAGLFFFFSIYFSSLWKRIAHS